MAAGEGDSGTPLPRKLGVGDGDVVCVVADPGHARELIAPLPAAATFGDDPRSAQVVLLFVALRSRGAERGGDREVVRTLLRATVADSGLTC